MIIKMSSPMSTKADNMILNTLSSAKSLFRKTRTDHIQEQLTDLQKAMSGLNAKMNHLVTENEKVKSLIRGIPSNIKA